MKRSVDSPVTTDQTLIQAKFSSFVSLFGIESSQSGSVCAYLLSNIFYLTTMIIKVSFLWKMTFSFGFDYSIALLHIFSDSLIITLSKSVNSRIVPLLLKDSLLIPILPHFSLPPEDMSLISLQVLYLLLILVFFLESEEKFALLERERAADTKQLIKDPNTAIAIYDSKARLIEYNKLFLSLFPNLDLSNAHYLQSIEGSATLKESLEISSTLDKGSWDFGEIIVSGTAYLCSGEITRFKNKKALFLRLFNIQCAYDLKNITAESNMKSELLRTVSHELRTPLNSIMNLINSVSEENGEPGGENLKIASYSCSYLLYLINDLIDYSQIKAGCLRISKSFFSLRSFLKECTDLIRYQASLKSLTLTLKIHENCPDKIYTDPFRLKQILLNLFSNSLKFTSRGGIELYVESQGPSLKFTCKDTGVGIEEDKFSMLFTLFGKDSKNEELNPQGAGLGLYISNILANKLGDRPIQVSSLPGSGSQFNFLIAIKPNLIQIESIEEIPEEQNDITIPCATTPQQLMNIISQIRNTHNRCLAEPIEEISVLVVDDCCFNTTVFSQILKKRGIYTHCVYNGKEAIEEIKNHPDRYHCVLLDCEMPVMNGWETATVLREMRCSSEYKKITAVIGTTAHDSLDVKEKCLQAGMDDVVSKPIDGDELVRIMMNWITKDRAQGSRII